MFNIKLSSMVLFSVAAGSSAAAQMDSSVFGTAMVQTGQAVTMANANGGLPKRAVRSRSTARARAACADQSPFRERFGADDPRVRRLAVLCRRAGYK